MSETKQPTADKQEAYQAFIAHYNLSPLNNDAIMNCLFELNEKINLLEMYLAKRVTVEEMIDRHEYNSDLRPLEPTKAFIHAIWIDATR